jgi:hypothetical protein
MSVGQHVAKLMKRLRYMETHKKLKPFFSQSCDKLIERIDVLLGDDEELGDIDNEPMPDSYEYWSKLRDF